MSTTELFILDSLSILFLLFGLFFMFLAALGLLRLPDIYNRMHAATKCVTLGITGLLLGAMFWYLGHTDVGPIELITKFILVIVFMFIANPVGGHIMGKAAHLDGAIQWEKTIDDELARDRRDGPPKAE